MPDPIPAVTEAPKIRLAINDWMKTADRHAIGGSGDPAHGFLVFRAKEEKQLFDQLESLHEEIARSFSQDPAVKSDPNAIAHAYKQVPVRAVLRSGVTWDDIQQMRRSRSVYLGTKVGDSYQTTVREPLPMPTIRGVKLAERIELSDKVRIMVSEDVLKEFDLQSVVGQHLESLRVQLEAAGLDPANIDPRNPGSIPVITERVRARAPEPEISEDPPEEPAAQPGTAEVLPAADLSHSDSDEEAAARAAADAQADQEVSGQPVDAPDSAASDSIIEPPPQHVSSGEPVMNDPAPIGSIKVLKPPFVRMNGARKRIANDLSHFGLHELAVQGKELCITKAVDTEDGIEIAEVSVDGTAVDFKLLCAEVAQKAGVPEAASWNLDLAREKIRLTLESLRVAAPVPDIVQGVDVQDLGRAKDRDAERPADQEQDAVGWGDGRAIQRPRVELGFS